MNVRILAFPLVLIASILLALVAAVPPAPPPTEAPGRFSFVRASKTLAEITRAPHVTGSAEHDRVRAYLITQFQAMGLTVSEQDSYGVRQSAHFGNQITASPVRNIIAVLPGRDPAKPAVALMAHYDSVPYAFGAGDDGAGTAALIETARQLSAGPKPARDVVFLITDAEELGLLGAQAFFSEHPLAKHIGAVVNSEARGSRGRATMFQTSRGNSALVALWARTAIAPSGSSLTNAIYKILPNDTDLSVTLDAGKIGINAAFGDGQFDYHAPSDSAANLDPGTLQNLGDFALTTTTALAMADALPERSGDSAYFDLFGRWIVHYPLGLGWLLIGIAALGLGLLRPAKLGTTWPRSFAAMLGIVALTLVAGALSQGVAKLLYGEDTMAMREQLAETGSAFWVYLALCVGLVMLFRPGAASRMGAMLLMLVLALVTQIMFRGANWLFVWPLLVAVGLAWLNQRGGIAVQAALGGIAFALVFGIVSLGYVMVGTMTPAIVALAVPFLILLLGPVMEGWREGRRGLLAGVALLALAGGGTLWLGLTDGFSQRQPRPGDTFFLADADSGKAWWATTSTPQELPGHKGSRIVVPAFSRAQVWGVKAQPAPAPRPNFAVSASNGRSSLSISAELGRLLYISVQPSAPVTDAKLNGKPVTLDPKGWTSIAYRAQVPAKLMLDFTAPAGATLAVRYLYAADGMPAPAPIPSGPPTNWTQLSGSSAVMGTARFRWP